jgi:acetyltransferase-like isoleucine patch superfamily enzyme
MQGQFKLLGDIHDLSVGQNCSLTREPWPFFDVTGGGIVFGDNVVISSGVHILTHDHQFEKPNWRDLDEVIQVAPHYY